MRKKINKRLKSAAAFALAAVLSISLLTGCGNASAASNSKESDGKLSVMASFYPVYDFAGKIGGDKVNVTSMVPSGTEPHDWEPAASDIVSLEEADVFVYSGAGMEHWVSDVLASLENKTLISVEASKGITLLKGHAHEEKEQGEETEESEFDPHVWLSPLNAKIEMENIKNAFVQADPDNKDYYEDNYTRWSDSCDELDQELKDTFSGLPKKDIVVSHEAFGYLCDAYGLNQVGIEGISPDSEPDPARMAEIQDFVTENNVRIIFSEELVSPKVAESIASATGAEVQTLNPLEGLSDEQSAAGDDYFSVMRQNMTALKAALE